MTDLAAKAAAHPQTGDIARAFVEARLRARALPAYPGPIPESLETAYQVQDLAISLWPDTVAGWKVGLIAPALQTRLGAARLAGAIFSRAIWSPTASGPTPFPIFEGGFSAVEAEFIVRMGRDAPAHVTDWTAENIAEFVGAIHVGVEFAGSPLATINDLGPTVVASDFGNNAGEIVGPEIPGWRDRPLESLKAETFINGVLAGTGSAASVPGGPLASLAFLASNVAQRGFPLKAGQIVTTGATTGIHEVKVGDEALVRFEGLAEFHCKAVAARPD